MPPENASGDTQVHIHVGHASWGGDGGRWDESGKLDVMQPTVEGEHTQHIHFFHKSQPVKISIGWENWDFILDVLFCLWPHLVYFCIFW